MNKLQKDLGKCMNNFKMARSQLNKCIVNALNRGLTQTEIMAVAQTTFSQGCELCQASILGEILKYEETKRKKPIDIVEEREFERGDI